LGLSPNGAYLAFTTGNGFSVISVARNAGVGPLSAPSLREQFSARQVAVAEPPIAVSPDGRVVVFTYTDGSASLAAAGTNVPIPSPRQSGLSVAPTDRTWFRGHVGPIVDVDFSIDGALISTSGADGTSRLWRNPVGRTPPQRPPSSSSWRELWKILRDQTTACLTAGERMRFLGEPEAAAGEAATRCEATYGVKAFATPSAAS
jgi:WD40 repeat protein